MKLEAIILDVDGTFAETADLHRSAYNRAFEEHDLDWVWTRLVYRDFVDLPDNANRILSYAAEYRPGTLEALKRGALAKAIQSRKNQIYSGMLEAGHVSLRPGVARLIREAHEARVPLAACTLSSRENFEGLLMNRLGVECFDWFATTVTSAELGPRASQIDAYALALRNIGTEAGNTVAIDDTHTGVAAAASLGMTVIATPGLYTRQGDFNAAHIVVSDLGHPAAPFRTVRGDRRGHSCVTVDALDDYVRERHAQAVTIGTMPGARTFPAGSAARYFP